MHKLFRQSRRTTIGAAVTLAAATAAVAFVSTAGAATGQQKPKPPTCRLGTLHGTYLFRGDGPHIEKKGPTSAMAYAGYFHFDGAGHIDRGYITTRVGEAIQSDRTLDGSTYTLGANCTGTFTINNPAHIPVFFDIFTTPSGNKFTYVQTDDSDEHYDVDATIAERADLG